MRRARGVVGVAVVAAAVMATATSCEPVPRLHLTVNSTAAGADDAVGDGVCSSAAAGGACTLQAAIAEGNASASGADIDVPPGTYPGADATITGDVNLRGGAPGAVAVGPAHLTVAPGARLGAYRIGVTSGDFDSSTLRFTVGGSLLLSQVDAGSLSAAAVTVDAGGSAWVTDSRLFGLGAVANSGTFYGVRTSISGGGRYGTAIATAPAGVTHLAASYVGPLTGGSLTNGGCTGSAPISHGYVHTSGGLVGCTLVASGTDSTGPAGSGATSVLVDAVPPGTTWCEAGSTDLLGTVRGNDGDADGVAGCDIGAVEYTP